MWKPLSALLPALILVPTSLTAQSWHPVLGFGPELLETTSPIPAPFSGRTSGFAPGYTLEAGLGYQRPGSRWGAELRGSHIRRSQHAADGCLNAAPDDCTLETQTRVTGLSLALRFNPQPASWLHPYVRGGLGVYQVYHSEPRRFLTTRTSPALERDTHEGVTPAILAGVGLQVGRARARVFLEATLMQYLRTGLRERSLPVLLGVRM